MQDFGFNENHQMQGKQFYCLNQIRDVHVFSAFLFISFHLTERAAVIGVCLQQNKHMQPFPVHLNQFLIFFFSHSKAYSFRKMKCTIFMRLFDSHTTDRETHLLKKKKKVQINWKERTFLTKMTKRKKLKIGNKLPHSIFDSWTISTFD